MQTKINSLYTLDTIRPRKRSLLVLADSSSKLKSVFFLLRSSATFKIPP